MWLLDFSCGVRKARFDSPDPYNPPVDATRPRQSACGLQCGKRKLVWRPSRRSESSTVSVDLADPRLVSLETATNSESRKDGSAMNWRPPSPATSSDLPIPSMRPAAKPRFQMRLGSGGSGGEPHYGPMSAICFFSPAHLPYVRGPPRHGVGRFRMSSSLLFYHWNHGMAAIFAVLVDPACGERGRYWVESTEV